MNSAFRFAALLLLWVAFIPAARAAPDTPRPIQTRFPTDDYVMSSIVVTEAPFNAPRDGQTDATAAFQAAIDEAHNRGGGVVFAPAGRYLFRGNLVLKEGVTLRGDWRAPAQTARVDGTILMPTAGRGQAEGAPFIAMQRGTGVRNLNVWYPDQKADDITAYPWTLRDDPTNTGNNFTIQDVTLVNSYQGIRFGPQFNELFTLRRVYGTPLKTGIAFDNISDIGRVLSTRFGARYWLESGLGTAPDAAKLKDYLRENGTAVDMKRSDWQYFYDVEVEGYALGLWIHRGENGAPIGVATEFRALDCRVGLRMEEARFAAVNCRFEGSEAAVETAPTFADDLQFVGCVLQSSNGPAIRHAGTGSVRAINSKLVGARSAAVVAQSGQLVLIDNDVPGLGTQIDLARPVARALLLGNRWGTPARAVNNLSRGDVQVDDKPLASPRLDLGEIVVPPDRKPATARVFDARDFGARPEKSDGQFDNTAAFQAALDAAGKTGGGTVYVAAGFYRFAGTLRVPSGVELRGTFDVPHHTVSLGAVLMPTNGRGDENAAPFISLAANAGLRGLTFWYPEQLTDAIVPYPWTVRALGPACWMMDVTSANSYNYVDFGSVGSSGHLLRYVAGSPLHRGIWVSKGSGTIDSCQFNPHYWIRRAAAAPPISTVPVSDDDAFAPLLDYIQRNHDAYIIGSAPREVQLNNFVYGARNGLRFVDDNGAAGGGLVVNHATDGASAGLSFDAVAPTGVHVVATQIAIVGPYARHGLIVGAQNKGPVNIVGGYSFASPSVPTMELYGSGETTVQSWHSSQSAVRVGGGAKRLEGLAFTRALPVAVEVAQPVARLEVVGNIAGKDVDFTIAPRPAQLFARANARAVPDVPLQLRFVTSFGPNDPPLAISAGAQNNMTDAKIELLPGAGREALVLSGVPDPAQQSLAYFKIYDLNLEIKPSTVLRYWMRPANQGSTFSGIDADMTQGPPLRDSGIDGLHPAASKGVAGYWSKIEFSLGQKLAGRTIKDLLFAFDQTGIETPIRVAVDRIEIGEPLD